jgi:epoxyqueuosine reductase
MQKDELKDFALKHGAHLIGIASAAALNQKAPRGHRPQDFMTDAQSVVVMAARLPIAPIQGLPEINMRLLYTKQFHVLEGKMDSLARDVALRFEDEENLAIPFPAGHPYSLTELAGFISHKHCAMEAGLGFFGINNLLITPQYGPRVRLVSVITNAALEPDHPFSFNICRNVSSRCNYACVADCPAKALNADGRIEKKKCADYMWNLPTYGRDEKKMVRCGLCIKNCPVGLTIKPNMD